MATFDQFIKSLEQDFGEQGKGKPFEVFCKWFLENDPSWSAEIDKVWLWEEYPEKWQRQDLGTDLVFRDKQGLIWAVQTKCYSEHRTTTKGDLNSFLADTGRREVHRRLWIQTTNKMEAKAEKTLKGQEKPVTVLQLNDFRDAQIDYPASFAELYQAKVKDKPKPEPHQVKAIADVVAGLSSADRGQLIMACGTGKTFTTLWIKEALQAHTTLVLLPSLSLLSQTMREWAWAGNTDFDILNVCSDKSVGKKTEDMDPADAPFPVTSEVDEIAAFLKQPSPKVVFCTYQSSDLIAQAQLDDAVPTFDLAVADEAHRCAGKADAGFATILDGEKIRASKRLFTTATPRYFGNAIRDEARARDLAVVGMDDEDIFGPVVHQLTFGQAIERERLTDYQVVIVGVDKPMIKEWIENGEILSIDPYHQIDARTLAAKIGLLKAVKDYDLKRVISFHSRVSGAKKFSEKLNTILHVIEPENKPSGRFLSDYVSGEMKAGDRKDKIDRLKALEGYERGILTNARCLAEGVDVPSLDGVAFIDPRGSQVEIIQAVGRAIRKVRGAKVQKKGTIVLPVFIEDGDDHEAAIEASNFKPVWDVLKALRAHDEVLAETLDQYRTNMAKNGSQTLDFISDKIILDLPLAASPDFVSALKTTLVDASTSSWEHWFGLLLSYVDLKKTAAVPINAEISDKKIGVWCDSQRVQYRKRKLSAKRIEKLETLLPHGWAWNLKDLHKSQNILAIKEYFDIHGHSFVPDRFVGADGKKLGAIAKSLRKSYADGYLSIADKEYLEKNLLFKWDPSMFHWLEKYKEIRRWCRKNRSCSPPNGTIIYKSFSDKHFVKIDLREFRLKLVSSYAYWNAKSFEERQSRKIPPVRLSERQVAAIEKIPHWSWNLRSDSWSIFIDKLNHLLERKDIDKINKDDCIGDYRVGQKLIKARVLYKKGKLPEAVADFLLGVGFEFDPFGAAWEKNYQCVLDYFVANPDAYISQDTTHKGQNIGRWVSSQRSAYKKGQLEDYKINKLNALPSWMWDASHLAASSISRTGRRPKRAR